MHGSPVKAEERKTRYAANKDNTKQSKHSKHSAYSKGVYSLSVYEELETGVKNKGKIKKSK